MFIADAQVSLGDETFVRRTTMARYLELALCVCVPFDDGGKMGEAVRKFAMIGGKLVWVLMKEGTNSIS